MMHYITRCMAERDRATESSIQKKIYTTRKNIESIEEHKETEKDKEKIYREWERN